jgi:HK97 family phage prohead protease
VTKGIIEMGLIGRIRGYAGLYDRLGVDKRGAHTFIAPGAFDGSLASTIAATLQHDPGVYLGDTDNGSLRLRVTPRGLFVVIDLPDNDDGQTMKRRLLSGEPLGMSFRFRDSRFVSTPDGSAKLIYRLYGISDVGPAENPAFKATIRHFRFELF